MAGNDAKSEDFSQWFRKFGAVDQPRLRLVCFPHAGGAAGTYRTWPRWLDSDVQLLAVQYPGRQDRLTQPVVDDMGEMVDTLTDLIGSQLRGRIAFFGHSMGGAIGYEVALRLSERFGRSPEVLMVSARESPDLAHRRRLDYSDDEKIAETVLRLEPSLREYIHDPDFREFALPALRGDFKLISDYSPDLTRRVPVPVVAYIGDADPDLTATDMARWSDYTEAGCTVRSLRGGHFYLNDTTGELVEDVAARLSATAPPRNSPRRGSPRG